MDQCTDFCRLHYISLSNEVEIVFHTDDTVRGLGYQFSWSYTTISDCTVDYFTNHTGTVTSLGYPAGYLLPYKCETWITAPGWIEFLPNLLSHFCTFSKFPNNPQFP